MDVGGTFVEPGRCRFELHIRGSFREGVKNRELLRGAKWGGCSFQGRLWRPWYANAGTSGL